MKAIFTIFLFFTLPLFSEPMKPKFEYTLFIAKPAQQVWEAITQKKIIDQYYMAPIHTLELKEGGKISYGVDKEFIVGEITKIDESTTLTHTFKFGGQDSPETIVNYSIEAVGDSMCSLTVTHTGFKSEDQTFADVTGGWPVILSSLKSVLETGKGMPWPKPEKP